MGRRNPNPLKLKQILSLLERLVCFFSSREPSWFGMICGASRQMAHRAHERRAVTLQHYLSEWTHSVSLVMHLLLHPEYVAYLPSVPVSWCVWSFKVAMEILPVIKRSLLFWHMTTKIYPRINRMKEILHCIWHLLVLF